jgi:protein-S-isoprenylcysteine O-methyltransferase Ste14
MPGSALLFFVVYLVLCFGLRTLVQRARTGSTGFNGLSGSPGSAEWTGGVLFIAAIVLGLAGPALQLLEVVDPIDALDGNFGHQAGGGLFFGGLLTTLLSQLAMGDSWRIGVDRSERTDLVTSGPFTAVRNPIFTGMVIASIGMTLLAPNPVSLLALVCLVAALEVQTRLVEEPYLLRVQGRPYREYAARAGRFLPLLGRLRDTTAGDAPARRPQG